MAVCSSLVAGSFQPHMLAMTLTPQRHPRQTRRAAARLTPIASAVAVALLAPATAQAQSLAAAVSEQFDATLVRPLGAIADAGQMLSGARQTRLGLAASVFDLSQAVVCKPPAASKPSHTEDDLALEGAFTLPGDGAAIAELALLFGLTPADLAQVIAVRYAIHASITSPQSKVLAAISRAAGAACPAAGARDASIVTSVVAGDVVLTIDLKRDLSAGAAAVIAQRAKVAVDPTGRRFALDLAGPTFTLRSRAPLVLGANLEPVASFRK